MKAFIIIRAIVLAIVCAVVGVWIYQDIVAVETTGSSKSMNVVLVMAYDYAGKWGVIGLWTIISCIFVAMSLKPSREDEPEQSEGQD